MQCERLIKLAKTWYLHVKEETMAPARMVQFIKEHVDDCPICQDDADIQSEIAKITEIILPESKIPKAVRMKQEMEEAKLAEEEEQNRQSEKVTGDDEVAEEQEVAGEDEFVEDEEEAPLAPGKPGA